MRILLHLTILIPIFSVGQVTFGNKVTLTGSLDEDRQVVGISSNPTSYNQAVNVDVIESNKLKFAEATGNGNNLIANLPIAPTSYIEGMSVYILTNNTNTGNMTININGLGIVPIYKNVSQEIEPNQVVVGQIIHLIYDGTAFQLMNDIREVCPSGFVDVNESYCIEINERVPAVYFDAINTCGNINAKLCSFDTWFYACQDINASAQLVGMIGNWEWLDAGGNNLSTAQSTINTAHIIGETSCTDNFTGEIKLSSTGNFQLLPYRCCYNK